MSQYPSEFFWCTADKIHNGRYFFTEKIYLQVHSSGRIVNIRDAAPEDTEIIHFPGILCPGFINAHCHLELSHMKGKIDKHTGLPSFLQQVITKNSSNVTKKDIIQVIENGFQKGIVAYGDIANTLDSYEVKNESQLHFHTFIESLGSVSQKAKQRFDYYKSLLQNFRRTVNPHHTVSLTIHAPYSISNKLYKYVNDFEEKSLLSIHSQETFAETELFVHRSGEFIDFYHQMNIPLDLTEFSGQNSLEWILTTISDNHTLLLVHNTFSKKEDWKKIASRDKTYVCLCPNANLYIENRLPDILGMSKTFDSICIGTDSLASNDAIDILSEMQSIRNSIPSITEEQLIRWATYNGAKVFGWKELGEIKIGNQCHLVNISKDFTHSALIV